MNSIPYESSYLLDSSTYQRRVLREADEHIIRLSAILLGSAHLGIAFLCLLLGSDVAVIPNAIVGGIAFGFAAITPRIGYAPWVHPVASALVLGSVGFFLFGQPGLSVVFPYILLPVPAFRVLGLRWGGFLSFGLLVIVSTAFLQAGSNSVLASSIRINVLIAIVVAILFGLTFEFTRWRSDRDLEGILRKLRVLHGVIPICAGCKMVREEDDSWRQIESLLQQKGQVEFSHGICQDCLEVSMEELNASA